MSEQPPTARRIGDGLRPHFARVFGFDQPPATYDTLWERMVATYEAALGRDLTLADLCTTDDSPHWAVVDGDRHHFQCVTDAFLLGFVLDDPVTARTVSPVAGTELVVEFERDGITAPEGAVLSYGVERTAQAPDGDPTPASMYGVFCPYSRAFASRAEYETWADADGVVSEARPLDASLDLLAAVLDETGPDEGSLETSSSGEVSGCSCCSG
jgi:hypothetical protein